MDGGFAGGSANLRAGRDRQASVHDRSFGSGFLHHGGWGHAGGDADLVCGEAEDQRGSGIGYEADEGAAAGGVAAAAALSGRGSARLSAGSRQAPFWRERASTAGLRPSMRRSVVALRPAANGRSGSSRPAKTEPGRRRAELKAGAGEVTGINSMAARDRICPLAQRSWERVGVRVILLRTGRCADAAREGSAG